MLRFNIIVPISLLAILAMLVVIYAAFGLGGVVALVLVAILLHST